MTRNDASEKIKNLINDSELNELEAFLLSDAVPEQAMMLHMVDGFLTSVIVGPVTLPSTWLPLIWDWSGGGKVPKFESVEQVSRMTDLLMKMSDRIIIELLLTDDFQTLPDSAEYEREEDKDNAVKLWASGFFTGVLCNASDWDEAAADKDVLMLLSAIYMFIAQDDDSVSPPILIEELRNLWKSIPECVRVINEFWHLGQRPEIARGNGMAIATEAERTGRNEPCPCGSGKKFKKCCGR